MASYRYINMKRKCKMQWLWAFYRYVYQQA